MSEKSMNDEPTSDAQERMRERQELISALRNFAEHFGAAEVYQEARAIYLASPAGRAERENEAAASFDSVLRQSNQSPSERQQRAAPIRRAGRGSSPLEDAKKALGG